MNVLQEDAAYVSSCDFIPWSEFVGKTVVVTGATGLIGQGLVRALAWRNRVSHAGIRIVALARNVDKAKNVFGDAGRDGVDIQRWDALDAELPKVGAVDYVIHAASITASRLFIEQPVETIETIVRGTRGMLELCRATGARMCYLSSMEVYGEGSDKPLTEEHGGAMDAMSVRSSYPQAKQLAETLCASYVSEYGTKACVARLAQTFGAGVAYDDNRVFAQFARACIKGEDIKLLTDGSKRNMYVYTADAVSALLLLVARGEAGQAYNVSNEDTFISIREMAQMVATRFGDGRVKVSFVDDLEAAKLFRKGNTLILDSAKLRALGWRPSFGLEQMYERMMRGWVAKGTV